MDLDTVVATPRAREEAIEILVQEYGLVANRNAAAIAAAEELLETLKAPQEAIKKQLVAMMQPGEKVDTSLAFAQMKNGYERTSWDNSRLEGYAVDHPEILQWRKVTSVKPSLSIKHKEP